MADPDPRDALQTVGDLIQDTETCMMTTRRPDGRLLSRPMRWVARTPFDGNLWFFTAETSRKVEDVAGDAHVNLAFQSDRHETAVSVHGTAEVTRDPATLDALWEPRLDPWFPEGRETDGLVLIRVEAEGAEYWDGTRNPLVVAFGLARGLLTDGTADTSDNARLSLDA